MYLVIHEDGEVFRRVTCPSALLKDADNGYVMVINITNPNDPREYYEKKWVKLDSLEE